MFTKSVAVETKVCDRRPTSPVPVLIRSFKCWGRRPSSPPAEPSWNDLTAARMANSDIRLFGCVLCVVALAAENSWVFAARGGCFNFSSSTAASVKDRIYYDNVATSLSKIVSVLCFAGKLAYSWNLCSGIYGKKHGNVEQPITISRCLA